mgnify:CR=1 FL=1
MHVLMHVLVPVRHRREADNRGGQSSDHGGRSVSLRTITARISQCTGGREGSSRAAGGSVGGRTCGWRFAERQARLLSAVLVAPSAFLAPSALRNRRSVAAELPRWLREIACIGTGGAASARHRSVRKRGGKISRCVYGRTVRPVGRSPCTLARDYSPQLTSHGSVQRARQLAQEQEKGWTEYATQQPRGHGASRPRVSPS